MTQRVAGQRHQTTAGAHGMQSLFANPAGLHEEMQRGLPPAPARLQALRNNTTNDPAVCPVATFNESVWMLRAWTRTHVWPNGGYSCMDANLAMVCSEMIILMSLGPYPHKEGNLIINWNVVNFQKYAQKITDGFMYTDFPGEKPRYHPVKVCEPREVGRFLVNAPDPAHLRQDNRAHVQGSFSLPAASRTTISAHLSRGQPVCDLRCDGRLRPCMPANEAPRSW